MVSTAESPASVQADAADPDNHCTVTLTRNQRRVFETLRGAETPLSAYMILDRLRSDGFRAPPQVYRALERLVDSGIVHRIESKNAFVACSAPQCRESATVIFMLCEGCGGVGEFTDSTIARRLDALCRARRFAAEKQIVEMRGRCAECRAV